MNEADFPALYQAADAASKKAQKHFFVTLAVNLSSLIIASALSVINHPSAGFSILQAFFLAIGLGVTVYQANRQPQRLWYSGRALSESIKTVSWRYIMRAEPYYDSESESRARFLRTLTKILDDNRHVCANLVTVHGADQLTQKMLDIRSLPLAKRKEFYQTERIEDQLTWYKAKADENQKKSAKWFWGLICVNSLAIALALAKIAFPKQEMWPTDIFVTAAGAIMAWLQTKRFQELAASYGLTMHEISLISHTMPSEDNEQAFSVFVADAESAFSREHTQWQARRDVN